MKLNTSSTLPIPVKRTLNTLGNNIKDARKRRRISTQIMAERACISRVTLNKIEKGDAGVSMGHYAAVLFGLGLSEQLNELADPRHDRLGLALSEELLPKRIRKSKRKV